MAGHMAASDDVFSGVFRVGSGIKLCHFLRIFLLTFSCTTLAADNNTRWREIGLNPSEVSERPCWVLRSNKIENMYFWHFLLPTSKMAFSVCS